MIRVVVANNHPIVRSGIVGLLSPADDIEVVGKGGWSNDVSVACRSRDFGVVVEKAWREDGASKLAYLFSPDEVGTCEREDPAF